MSRETKHEKHESFFVPTIQPKTEQKRQQKFTFTSVPTQKCKSVG